MAVKHGTDTFILCGPPQKFVEDAEAVEEEPMQMALF